MGRLGLVAAPGRSWRPYAGPIAFLLVVTLVVAVVRNGMQHGTASAKPVSTVPAVHHKPAVRKLPAVYVVRAGDTMTSISAKTKIPAATLLQLNPKITPTALFIGQRLRLR
jgi:LysM repeat protein